MDSFPYYRELFLRKIKKNWKVEKQQKNTNINHTIIERKKNVEIILLDFEKRSLFSFVEIDFSFFGPTVVSFHL